MWVELVDTVSPRATAHRIRISIAWSIAVALWCLAIHVVLVATEALPVPLQAKVRVTSTQISTSLLCDRLRRVQEEARLKYASEIYRAVRGVNPATDVVEWSARNRPWRKMMAAVAGAVERSSTSLTAAAARATSPTAVYVRFIAILHSVIAREAYAL